MPAPVPTFNEPAFDPELQPSLEAALDPRWPDPRTGQAPRTVLLLDSPLRLQARTMVARRIPSLLRRRSAPARRASAIAWAHAKAVSDYATLPEGELPFRAPHHSITPAGLWGTWRRPGEMMLAAGGVLYIDEPTKWDPRVLSTLILEHGAESPLGPQLLVLGSPPAQELDAKGVLGGSEQGRLFELSQRAWTDAVVHLDGGRRGDPPHVSLKGIDFNDDAE